MSRVLIADDHAVVRAGFKQFLEADPSINAVGEAASGNETLDQLRESGMGPGAAGYPHAGSQRTRHPAAHSNRPSHACGCW